MIGAEKNTLRRVASAGGIPQHYNGSVGTTKTETLIEFNSENQVITNLKIKNTHASQDLEVYLDGTANFWSLAAGETLEMPCSIQSFELRGSGVATTYESIVTF